MIIAQQTSNDMITRALLDPHRIKMLLVPNGEHSSLPTREVWHEVRHKLGVAVAEAYAYFSPEFFCREPIFDYSPSAADKNFVVIDKFANINEGRFKASLFWNQLVFDALPNPKGRPYIKRTIEQPFADALAVEVYQLVRFICGMVWDQYETSEQATDHAVELLVPHLLDVADLHHHQSSEISKPEQERDDRAKKLIYDLCSQAPSILSQQSPSQDRRAIGQLYKNQGRALAEQMGARKLEDVPELRNMLDQLIVMVELRKCAAAAHRAIRELKTSQGSNIPPSFEEAAENYRHLNFSMQALVGADSQMKPVDAIAIAEKHELDVSLVGGVSPIYRPLICAVAAVAAYYKRNEQPTRFHAIWGLYAWSNDFGGFYSEATEAAQRICMKPPSEIVPKLKDCPIAPFPFDIRERMEEMMAI